MSVTGCCIVLHGSDLRRPVAYLKFRVTRELGGLSGPTTSRGVLGPSPPPPLPENFDGMK